MKAPQVGEYQPLNPRLELLNLGTCPNPVVIPVECELDSRYLTCMENWRQHALGTLLCIGAAGLFAFSFHGSRLQNSLPFLFIALIGLVADRFGGTAGILGSVCSAIVFAEFLFQPVLSLRVSDSIQRDNLVWMVIIGIVISELLGVQPTSPSHRDDPNDISGI